MTYFDIECAECKAHAKIWYDFPLGAEAEAKCEQALNGLLEHPLCDKCRADAVRNLTRQLALAELSIGFCKHCFDCRKGEPS